MSVVRSLVHEEAGLASHVRPDGAGGRGDGVGGRNGSHAARRAGGPSDRRHSGSLPGWRDGRTHRGRQRGGRHARFGSRHFSRGNSYVESDELTQPLSGIDGASRGFERAVDRRRTLTRGRRRPWCKPRAPVAVAGARRHQQAGLNSP